MRMIPACFAPALQRWTSRKDMHFLLTFQKVVPISKTCNQLEVRAGDRGETHKPSLPTATRLREPPRPGHQLVVGRWRPAQRYTLPSTPPPCEGVRGADDRGACHAVTQFCGRPPPAIGDP